MRFKKIPISETHFNSLIVLQQHFTEIRDKIYSLRLDEVTQRKLIQNVNKREEMYITTLLDGD